MSFNYCDSKDFNSGRYFKGYHYLIAQEREGYSMLIACKAFQHRMLATFATLEEAINYMNSISFKNPAGNIVLNDKALSDKLDDIPPLYGNDSERLNFNQLPKDYIIKNGFYQLIA